MAERGRPTKLNDQVQHTIVQALRAGNYVETAVIYAGVSKTAFYEWLHRGHNPRLKTDGEPYKADEPFVEFADAVERAQAESEVHLVATVRKASQGQWQAAMTLLERKFPKKWGRRDHVELTGEDGGPVEISDPRTEIARRISGMASRVRENGDSESVPSE